MERKRWQTRLLAMLLTFMMVFTTPMNAMASGRAVENDEQTTTTPAADAKVTLTVGMKGALATDKDGKVMLARTVTVKDTNEDGKLTYDEALAAAHEAYFAEGANGYESESSDTGNVLKKFWGDSSGAFGYWKNDNSCWSLSDEVEAGDCLTAFVYKDATGWSDAYARFDNSVYLAVADAASEISLEKAVWNVKENKYDFVTFSGATFAVYDSAKEPVSEDSYMVSEADITFYEAGTYYLVATGTENQILVPSITKVIVKKNPTPVLKSIKLNYESRTVPAEKDDYTILKATYEPADIENVAITWTSSNPEIAKVEDGKVYALTPGETVITASVGNVKAECKYKVTAPPELSSIKCFADANAYKAGTILQMTPEFEQKKQTGYTVFAPDYLTNLYIEGTIAPEYVKEGYKTIYFPGQWGNSGQRTDENGVRAYNAKITGNKVNVYANRKYQYQLDISRCATLTKLVTSGRMQGTFDKNEKTYQVLVDNATGMFKVTPTAYNAAYTIKVNNNVVEGGSTCEVPYNWDKNGKMEVLVEVGGENVTTSTYTLKLEKTDLGSAPVIQEQPKDADYIVNEEASPLTVDAISNGNITYQWYSNSNNSIEGGNKIENATEKDYVPSTTNVGTAYYYCVVTNTGASEGNQIVTNIVTVVVDKDPTPSATLNNPGSTILDEGYKYDWDKGYIYNVGDKATALTVTASTNVEGGTLSYEWKRIKKAYNESVSSSKASGENTEKEYTPQTTLENATSRGYYYACEVTCTFKEKKYTSWATTGEKYKVGDGEDAKSYDVIGVYVFTKTKEAAKPEFTMQPKAGGTYVLENSIGSRYTNATIADGGELTYQWYVNEKNSTEGGTPIANATSSYYKFGKASEIGTKYYYCVATNTNQGFTATTVSDVIEIIVIDVPAGGDKPVEDIGLNGDGTEENPYQIKTAEDYITVANLVEEGTSFAGKYLKQERNITLPKGWKPIGVTKDGSSNIQEGENLNPFSGTLDGNGKTIIVPEGGLPLLGYVKDAKVRNLNIYGKKIAGYGLVNNYVGVGLSGTGIIIDNVTLKSGSSTLKSGLIGTYITTNGYAGCSATFTGTISNCIIEEGVVIGYDKDQSMIGSIAGRFQGSIKNCKSYATVYGVDYVGGILGTCDNALGGYTVSACTFNGTVEASGTHVGGVAGGGYNNSTAPNGNRISITGCNVAGKITGADKVAGILGADSYVAQGWAGCSIKGNSFDGKVNSTEGSYVGGIIGYYNSINNKDTIMNNYYAEDCGTEKGIGFIKYIDTNAKEHENKSGAFYFNTEKDTKGCPDVTGAYWHEGLNRTDDPLGADADKLASNKTKVTKYVDELKVSGTYKTDYYLGEELDLTGMEIVAYYSDGETKEVALSDLTIKGYDNTTRGNQELILGYEGATAEITVRVLKKAGKVRVQFQLLGDEAHGTTGEEHTLMHKNLKIWIPNGFYELDENSTVYDLLRKIEKETEGLTINSRYNSTYKSQYIYGMVFKGVTLDELTNGANSGWMYTLNGKHVQVGVSNQYLEDGDAIVFHYTDNYTLEESKEYDQEQVDSAVEAVNSIPALDKLTKDDAGLVKRVRNAYENLSDAQKKLFPAEMLAKLEAAEAKIKELTETHVHKWDAGVETKAATCTTDGVKTYTCACNETKTEVIKATGHKYGAWKKVTAATISKPEKQQRVCSVCQHVETRNGAKAKATIKVTASTITLKTRQKTSKFKVTGLAKGDAVKQYKSSNPKIFTVTKKGVITAGKKTGKATLTITLKSGLKKKVTVKIQKKAVAPTKITGLKSKVSLKKGKKLTLKPAVKPFTCVQKVTYTSSKKGVATVSSKGTIKALKEGKTKITVKCGKRRFVVNVTVTKK